MRRPSFPLRFGDTLARRHAQHALLRGRNRHPADDRRHSSDAWLCDPTADRRLNAGDLLIELLASRFETCERCFKDDGIYLWLSWHETEAPLSVER
jgi:hypothetical protein